MASLRHPSNARNRRPCKPLRHTVSRPRRRRFLRLLLPPFRMRHECTTRPISRLGFRLLTASIPASRRS